MTDVARDRSSSSGSGSGRYHSGSGGGGSGGRGGSGVLWSFTDETFYFEFGFNITHCDNFRILLDTHLDLKCTQNTYL